MVPALSQVPPLAMPLPRSLARTHLVPLGAEPGIILSKFGFRPQNSAGAGPQFQGHGWQATSATSHAATRPITLDSAIQDASDESSESDSDNSRRRDEDGTDSCDEEALAQVPLGSYITPLSNDPFVNYEDEGTGL